VVSSNNIILAVDCALRRATVALLRDDKLLSSQVSGNEAQHSRALLPLIRDVLHAADVDLAQIDAVLFSYGPGGFTSLRVGLATLQGLFWESKVRFFVISSLRLRCESLRILCEAEGINPSACIGMIRAGEDSCYVGRLTQTEYGEDLMTHVKILQDNSNTAKLALGGEGLRSFTSELFVSPVLFLPEDPVRAEAFLSLWHAGVAVQVSLAAVRLNYLKKPV
jgi:tRNA threonylcarbamoyl adenosine modification protein YeaZ